MSEASTAKVARVIWLHYGVASPRWDEKILGYLRECKDTLEIIPLDINNVTFDTISHLHNEFRIALIVNRVSDARAPELVKMVLSILRYCEDFLNIRTLNGLKSYSIGCSKALQCKVLESLGLHQPKTHMVRRGCSAEEAKVMAQEVGFPLLIKPNAGGFGSGIEKISSETEFEDAVLKNLPSTFDKSNDGVLLFQRFHDPASNGGEFFRLWHLDGEILCATRVLTKTNEESYNSCACSPTKQFVVFTPSEEIRKEVKSISKTCCATMGSVEYLVDSSSSNQRLYFDINMLSTLPLDLDFESEDAKVSYKDPHKQVADYIRQNALAG